MTSPDKPTGDQVRVALSALRDDAETWARMADVVRAAAQVAERLDLGAFHLSYLGDKVGLTEIYREIHDKLVRLLDEGGAAFDALATTLRSAADQYEDEDGRGAHELYGY